MPVQTAVNNTTYGTSNALQWTDTINGKVIEWYTPKLEAVTLSGIAVGNIRVAESNAAANITPRLEIAITDGNGNNPIIWGAATANTEASTTEGATTIYVAGPDTEITAGQRIRFRVYINQFEARMSTVFTGTLYYNGSTANASGDTYVTLPVTLTEQVTTTTTTTTPPAPSLPSGVQIIINQSGIGNIFTISQNPNVGNRITSV